MHLLLPVIFSLLCATSTAEVLYTSPDASATVLPCARAEPCRFPSALDLAQDGDVIQTLSGTYKITMLDGVSISRRINIIADQPGQSIFDFSGAAVRPTTGFQVRDTTATIEGLVFTKFEASTMESYDPCTNPNPTGSLILVCNAQLTVRNVTSQGAIVGRLLEAGQGSTVDFNLVHFKANSTLYSYIGGHFVSTLSATVTLANSSLTYINSALPVLRQQGLLADSTNLALLTSSIGAVTNEAQLPLWAMFREQSVVTLGQASNFNAMDLELLLGSSFISTASTVTDTHLICTDSSVTLYPSTKFSMSPRFASSVTTSVLTVIGTAQIVLEGATLDIYNSTVTNSTGSIVAKNSKVDIVETLIKSSGSASALFALSYGSSLSLSTTQAQANVGPLISLLGSSLEAITLDATDNSVEAGPFISLKGGSTGVFVGTVWQRNVATTGPHFLVAGSSSKIQALSSQFADNNGDLFTVRESARLEFEQVTISRTIGRPIIANGANVSLDNFRCEFNNASSSGGCLQTQASDLLIIRSYLRFNQVPELSCGGAIALLDMTRTVTVTNSTFQGNSATYGGVACLDNVPSCDPSRLLLIMSENMIINNTALNGGVLYFGADINTQLTPLPDCASAVNEFANTVISLPMLNPHVATYPYRLHTLLTTVYIVPLTATPGYAEVIVSISDYFNQNVLSNDASKFTICAASNSSEPLQLGPNPQNVTTGETSFNFTTQPGTLTGSYSINFGGSAAVCPTAQPNLLPEADMNARILIKRYPLFASPVGTTVSNCTDPGAPCNLMLVLSKAQSEDTLAFLPGQYYIDPASSEQFFYINKTDLTFIAASRLPNMGHFEGEVNFDFSRATKGFTLVNAVNLHMEGINFGNFTGTPPVDAYTPCNHTGGSFAWFELCNSSASFTNCSFANINAQNVVSVHLVVGSDLTLSQVSAVGANASGPSLPYQHTGFLLDAIDSTVTIDDYQINGISPTTSRRLAIHTLNTSFSANNVVAGTPLCNLPQLHQRFSNTSYCVEFGAKSAVTLTNSNIAQIAMRVGDGVQFLAGSSVLSGSFDLNGAEYAVFLDTTYTIKDAPAVSIVNKTLFGLINESSIFITGSQLHILHSSLQDWIANNQVAFFVEMSHATVLVEDSTLDDIIPSIGCFNAADSSNLTLNRVNASGISTGFVVVADHSYAVLRHVIIETPNYALVTALPNAKLLLTNVTINNGATRYHPSLIDIGISVEVAFTNTRFTNCNGTLVKSLSPLAIDSSVFRYNNGPKAVPMIQTSGAELILTNSHVSSNLNYESVIRVSGNRLQISNSRIEHNTGISTIKAEGGTSLDVDDLICSFNTVSGFGGCISLSESSIIMYNSTFSDNIVPDTYCGGAIAFNDLNLQSRIEGCTFTSNKARLGGAICLFSTPACTSEGELRLDRNTVVPSPLTARGGLIYFSAAAGEVKTPLPECSDAVLIRDTNMTEGAVKIRGSYPYRIIPHDTSATQLGTLGQQAQPASVATVVDFFNNTVPQAPNQGCIGFSFCAKLGQNAPFANGVSCQPNGSITVNIPFNDQTEAGNYDLLIGQTRSVCVSGNAGPLLPEPDAYAKFQVVSDSSRALKIALGVVGGVIGLAGLITLIVVLRKRAMKKAGTHFATPRKSRNERRPLLAADPELGSKMRALLASAKVPLVDPNEIDVIETIGAGATGLVVVAKWTSRHNMMVAVKQLANTLAAEGWSDIRKQQVQELVQEIVIMTKLSHPNLLPLLACAVLSDSDVRLVMPYCANRSLSHHIETLDRGHVLSIARQIAYAIEYLHTKNIVHSDLKPENVMLGKDWEVYIGDFCMSKIESTLTVTSTELAGTPAYMAPELIRSGKSSKATDVYAFGTILLELITQSRVYPDIRPIAIMHKVCNEGVSPEVPENLTGANRPDWLPEGLIDLAKRCFAREPADRPEFKEICDELRHM